MIPRLKPFMGIDDLFAAISFFKSKSVEKFESEFAKKVNQKYAIAFPYGRTALMILLEAMNLKKKEIICPAYTCIVVPHAIVFSENDPVFLDSNPNDFNMDLKKIEPLLNNDTGAIVATSIFGYPINLDELKRIKKKYPNIKIIQDCAHSFTANYHGEFVHTVGDAAIFAMNISKHMNSIFGGMVTTDDADLAKKLIHLRDSKLKSPPFKKTLFRLAYLFAVYPTFHPFLYGIVNWMERKKLLGKLVEKFDSKIFMPDDYLDKMIDVEARVGISQLKKIDRIIQDRVDAVNYYFDSLKDIKEIQLPPKIEGATYSHFTIQVENRDKLISYMLDKAIQLGQLIEYSVPELDSYKNRNYRVRPECNVASNFVPKVVNLPISSGMKDVQKVVSELRKYYGI
ncbi:MAG TPA: DegT/DnrJ/EryC1/StrS family aminotransferase [Leptospiraceae bacterium]|nr:DegT/DnrJ/EryC1/StrS family aminotransferase [Leptospiraceae bacterium]HMX31634.1 DegT/DnrJ/EryC1/StrS family aminotransferase [Leptospiraceae bacterium]HMY30481.1 DegT/DnrJ/EryC1/StrS family aminotransferase [Leptospiraceae bacterium]HMZ65584.1 DegT/DnrJ/EryC1/StrS family aminotransferase [Leptospiraceae bacterium]HNA06488.1 DegT/DnrJ/EryC1/StrS family aminotransferase [Leptospiraceae bacterium]